MKKPIRQTLKALALLSIIILTHHIESFGQSTLLEQVEYEKIENKLYISFPLVNGDTLAEYSIDDRNNFLDLPKDVDFTQKNHLTINVEWLNPINFQLSVKDTLIADPTNKIIDDFLSQVTGQFGIPPMPASEDDSDESSRITSSGGTTSQDEIDNLLSFSFNDLNLAAWAIMIKSINARGSTDENERQAILEMLNRFTPDLKYLDTYLANEYDNHAKQVFVKLKSIYDPYIIVKNEGSYKVAKDSLASLNTSYSEATKKLENVNKQTTIQKVIWTVNSTNQNLEAYTLSILRYFNAKAKSILETRSKRNTMLGNLIKSLEKSTNGADIVEHNNKLYKKVKTVKRNRTKITQLELSLKVFSYENDDVSKKSEKIHATYKSRFQRYRWLIPGASIGAFYSSLKLTTFEAGTDGLGNTIVQELENDSGPVYALMLNFYLNTKNSDLLPFFQLGVDPTKERPFLLLGGGLSIPQRKFSISGGLAWSWIQSLDKLSIGGPADSAAAIKDDIVYEFSKSPKAYFGIQYQF